MPLSFIGIILGAIWGLILALALQTYIGKFMAARFTWLTVVIGVGVDLLIALLIVPLEYWLPLVALVGASSVAIIGRSIYNELRDWITMIRVNTHHDHTDQAGE
jgi:hypothetical protein